MNIQDIRKEIVKEYVTLKYKDLLSREDLEDKIQSYILLLNDNEIMTTLREQSQKTNSSDINATTNELFLDLSVIYRYIDNLEDELYSKINMKISNMLKVKNTINKLNNIQINYMNIINTKQNPIVIYNDLTDNSTMENDNSWYKERYGESIEQYLKNIYNKQCNLMQLPKTMQCNEAYNNKVLSATISINNRYSDYDVVSNDVSNILLNNNIPWNLSILSNKPIKIQNDETTNRGALIEVIINFEYLSIVNELIIEPLTKYPMKILSVKCFVGTEYEEIVYKDNPDETLTPKILYDTVSYKFNNTKVTSIHILLNQIHYERNSFIFNKLTYKLNCIDRNKDIDIEGKIFTPIYSDINNSVWNYISNFNTNQLLSIDRIFNNSNRNKNTIKYEYQCGLKALIPYNNEFEKCGMYVSKLIKVDNVIKQISIITTQTNKTNKYNEPCTDIEYYINFSNNENYKDWVPILPQNSNNVINAELLQMYNDLCYLRFKGKEIYNVLKDSNPIIENVDYYLKKDVNNNVYAIEIPEYDFNSLYSINYKAVDGSDVISLNNKELISTTEEFKCNNKSIFVLDNNIAKPFDVSNIYLEIFKDNEILYSSNINIKCVENLVDNELSYANFTKDGVELEYYVSNNKIYFNKQLQDNWTLKVSYKHEINSFRLKAILRRNSKYDKNITPEIKDIKYIVNVK